MNDFWSGVVAGLMARLMTSPLDLAKIRLQVQDYQKGKYASTLDVFRKAVREEGGLLALWKGNLAGLTFYGTYTGIQFYVINDLLVDQPWGKGTKGAAAATIAHILTYPLDVWRTRSTLRKISLPIGLASKSPLSGLPLSLLQTVPYMALVFHFQSLLTEQWQMAEGTSGFVAGSLAKICVLPVDVLKRRIQTFSTDQSRFVVQTPTYRDGAKGLVSAILAREGWRAMFAALPVTLLKASVTSAVTFHFFNLLHTK